MTETHLVADVETVNHIRGASFRATSGEEEEEEEEEEASEADTWAGKNGLENSRRRFLLPPVVAPSIYDRIFCAAIFFSSSLKIFQRNRGRGTPVCRRVRGLLFQGEDRFLLHSHSSSSSFRWEMVGEKFLWEEGEICFFVGLSEWIVGFYDKNDKGRAFRFWFQDFGNDSFILIKFGDGNICLSEVILLSNFRK